MSGIRQHLDERSGRMSAVPRLQLSRSGPWIGVGGLACLLWLVIASVLFAPGWGVGLMLLVWLATVALAVGWARPHPAWVAYVPLGGLAVWVALVAAGVEWWGWG
jgi:hypothetical protein